MGPPYKISTLLGGVVLIAYYILKLKRGSVEVRYIYYTTPFRRGPGVLRRQTLFERDCWLAV